VPIIGMPPADPERSYGLLPIAARCRHADSGPLTCCLLGISNFGRILYRFRDIDS